MNRKSVGLILPALFVLAALLFFGYSLTRAQAGQRAAKSAVVGSAFTYQGRLNDEGVPANGNYDFEFGLFDALTIGSQVGITESQTIMVSDGLFTTALDFGADVFNGEPRYLQIAVKFGIGGYTTLTPRQPLTAVPYASYADKVQPLENVVNVAKSGGDYTSVQDALDNITATVDDRYVIRVAPGVYTGTVDLESYVDIEGSGAGITILRGLGGNTTPFVDGSSATVRASGALNAEVRWLTVESDGSTGQSYATAIRTSGASATLHLTHVTATASGSINYTVFNIGSSPTMNNVTATASGGSNSIGVYNTNNANPTMNNVTATATGGTAPNTGVYNNNTSSPTMNNVTATATGGTINYGVYNTNNANPTMNNVTATASGGSRSTGVYNQNSNPAMNNVTATATGGTIYSYGVNNNGSSWPTIRDSALTGSTNSIINEGFSNAKVANTMLAGPVAADVDSPYTCFNTYDAAFAAVTCP